MSISISEIPASIRTILLVFAGLLGAGSCTPNSSSSSAFQQSASTGEEVVPGEVLVQFQPGTTSERIEEILAATGARVGKSLGTPLVYMVQPPDGSTAEVLIQRLREYHEVLYAEPNRLRRAEPPPAFEGAKPGLKNR